MVKSYLPLLRVHAGRLISLYCTIVLSLIVLFMYTVFTETIYNIKLLLMYFKQV